MQISTLTYLQWFDPIRHFLWISLSSVSALPLKNRGQSHNACIMEPSKQSPMRQEIVPIPWPIVKGRQYDRLVRYFKGGIAEQLTRGILLAGPNVSEHSSIYAVTLRQRSWDFFLVYLIQGMLKELSFVSIPVLFMCLCTGVFLYVHIYYRPIVLVGCSSASRHKKSTVS